MLHAHRFARGRPRVVGRSPAWIHRAPAAIAALAALCSAPLAHADPDVSPRGRLHLDTAFHAGEDDAEFADGFNTRRARMGLEGTLDEDWDFQIEFDFAEEGVSANDVRLRRSLPAGRLAFGQFKVPMSLNQLTSSNDIPFVERAPAANIVAPARRLGVGYHYWGDRFGLQTMVYGRAIGDDTVGDMPVAFGARGVLSPAVGGGRLHVGASGAFEHLQDETALDARDRPEARGADGGTFLIDTGPLAAESLARGGAELAFLYGPFSAEAEYLGVLVNRDGPDDLLFDGFHIQASYVLTGETRGYSNGTFDSPSPARDSGAWEAAARLSHMDLDDAEIEGGTQDNVTIGVNWYASDNVRFMLNHVWSFVDDGPFGDESVNIAVARIQYNF